MTRNYILLTNDNILDLSEMVNHLTLQMLNKLSKVWSAIRTELINTRQKDNARIGRRLHFRTINMYKYHENKVCVDSQVISHTEKYAPWAEYKFMNANLSLVKYLDKLIDFFFEESISS